MEALKPEYIAPVVLYLCHESCTDTHGIYEVSAGWVAKTRIQRSEGVLLRDATHSITPEAVRDNWDAICDFTTATYPNSTHESGANMFDNLEKAKEEGQIRHKKAAGKSSSVDAARAKAFRFPPLRYDLTPKDLKLYAVASECVTLIVSRI